jgi:hypothetical protein
MHTAPQPALCFFNDWRGMGAGAVSVFPPAATCASLTSCLIFLCLDHYSSDLNQDSLDGAQASVSEVGSAEEFEKENTEDTPSGSHGEADGNKKKP